MAGAKVPLTFRIFKGNQLVREERLSLSVIKLGKVPSAHLKLDDETVSRMHAIIEVNGPGDVSIIDLGSTKGTFVNGQKVNKAKLQSGDTIVVGETRIELAIAAEEDEPIRGSRSAAPASEVVSSSSRPPSSSASTMSAAGFPPRPSGSSGSGSPSFTPPQNFAPPTPAHGFAPPTPAQSFAPPTPPQSFAPPTPPQSFAAQSFAPPTPAQSFAPPTPPQSFAPPTPVQSFAPPPPPPGLRPPPGLPGGAPIFGTAMAPPVGFQQALAESIDDFTGARAVEVAAMMGDSVVGVKHCMDPRSGKITPASYALFAVGVVTLLLSIGAFAVSVNNASYNKGGLDAWIKGDREHNIDPRPAYAYRPKLLSAGYDWVAFGGIAVSLLSLTLGVSRASKERQNPFFRIGTAPGVEFATEGAPSESFPLIAPEGDEFAFNFAPGMEGEMMVGGQTTALAELAQQGRTRIAPIPPGAKIRVRTGRHTTFLISAVARPRRQTMPLFAAIDTLFASSFGGTAAVFGLLILLLWQVAPEDAGANLEYASLEDTSTRTSSTAQDDPLAPKPEDKPDTGANQSGGTGTAMQLDEGKMGKKDSDRATGQYKMAKTQDTPQLAREQALEDARNAGFLGSTALTQGGAFASLTGTGNLSSGFDDNNIYGGLLGNEAGEMSGGFGYGRSGFGPGGGGTGWDTIGTGRYGTIGHGSGAGQGYGAGGGRGSLRGRTAAVPSVAIGQPSSSGDLDKAIIRRYINRNLQKIRYCYEKQLLAKPTLAGTVQSQFFITPNGTVASSNASGVDGEVASCVADVIKNIEFPKPNGGGSVQVNYPFIFHASGSS
jgi:pSer/pThr/pTyr-binding forkhead associated (FHA) protein